MKLYTKDNTSGTAFKWWHGNLLCQHLLTRLIHGIKCTEDIKNNAWATVNNDFFCHSWGDSGMSFTRDGNECITLFLTRYFMSWTHKSAKNYHRALISPLLPRAAFSDRALWRHHNWSVTSCEREILVLWRHICILSLHAQIGAKAIFTSE